jgi:RNA polymerase sigma factor (sigma-70 family)
MCLHPLPTLTDEALVARFRAGDDAAFTVMHDRYRPALQAFARRMLHGSGHEADDVVQDAFIRAHRSLRATDRPMALRPWLYMIVRNRALDDLRGPRRADDLGDEPHLAAVPEDDPANRAVAREELRRLVAEIGRLPERQRLALVMRELDGRTHVETAAALHTTVPATKSLLVRARQTLEAGRAA